MNARQLLQRTHGGAIKRLAPSLPYEVRQELLSSAKDSIGKLAATLVEEGDAIIIGSGTTTYALARSLTVGRATIERRFVGAVDAFRKEEATAERGTRLNGLAYLCIRGWIDPVVKIQITDPSDQTPYWLTSSRHPDKLTAALARR